MPAHDTRDLTSILLCIRGREKEKKNINKSDPSICVQHSAHSPFFPQEYETNIKKQTRWKLYINFKALFLFSLLPPPPFYLYWE